MCASKGGCFHALPGLEAANYSCSPLHADSWAWVEKYCYVEVWIELLHRLGMDSCAPLSTTLAVDFEGDQWTFFKPPHYELWELHAVDVQELMAWKPLIEYAKEHPSGGNLISSQADAFWLPDNAGTDDRRRHTKSTIVPANIDVDAERLGYFHNTGYFELVGEDFRQLFRLGHPHDPAFMPLYAKFVRVDRRHSLPSTELRRIAGGYLRHQLTRRPENNPLREFQARFARERPIMQAGGLGTYHLWAFATIRQLGAAMGLAAGFVRWMWSEPNDGFDRCSATFDQISQASKTLILKAARAVNSKRALDADPLFDGMAAARDPGIGDVTRLVRA